MPDSESVAGCRLTFFAPSYGFNVLPFRGRVHLQYAIISGSLG